MTMTKTASIRQQLDNNQVHKNLSSAQLVEQSIKRDEGILAANGALLCLTGPYTGRSPNDKWIVEDHPETNDSIWWGPVNKAISSNSFEILLERAVKHLQGCKDLFEFCGYAGADPEYRLNVQVISEKAWHSLFASTLFIKPDPGELAHFKTDWTIVNACELQVDDWKELGLSSNVGILQSLERKIVLIFGTHYAGEIKKSIFYAMNYDMPDKDVCPMHCSANVAIDDQKNVALFFGLSGTGKTTLSADPDRALIGDDEHGWSKAGVFNFEGGCYAKCIKLSEEGEPQIWNAIKFGSVLENVVLDDNRVPDYDDGSLTENTRVTYPVDFIPNAQIPSKGNHPGNVIFLTADAFGVVPPVSKLTREQAMYYFVNGYTSKLAGTERGVKDPQPSFSPCFGGPFLARPPLVYAQMLAQRIEKYDADVWLLNTGWSGGPYGEGSRFKLAYTRAMVTAILNGSLRNATFAPDEIFGLYLPNQVVGVPSEVLKPRSTWKDPAKYDAKAYELAKLFRENDKKYDLPDNVLSAGPNV